MNLNHHDFDLIVQWITFKNKAQTGPRSAASIVIILVIVLYKPTKGQRF